MKNVSNIHVGTEVWWYNGPNILKGTVQYIDTELSVAMVITPKDPEPTPIDINILQVSPKQLKHPKVMCPDCQVKMKFKSEHNTDWYGNLKYFHCPSCKTEFVSQNDGEINIAAHH